MVSYIKSGLSKVARGVGNGLKALGKKIGEMLPGLIGAIASFLFKTAGEVVGFLANKKTPEGVYAGCVGLKLLTQYVFFADCAIMDIHGAIQPDLHVIRSYSQ